MKIFLATDHAGFELKEEIKKKLEALGNTVFDCGAFELNPNDDYPDFVADAARKVSEDTNSIGIVLGKSGAGEAIVANKIKGIRAFQAINVDNVRLAREHNNANVMSIGSEFINIDEIDQILKAFINTQFSNEDRHVRRIEKIKSLES